jgi:SPP1 gp7 family putative phage head morphogenesis protein
MPAIDLWEPKRRIEKNYAAALRRLTRYLNTLILGAATAGDIVTLLRQAAQSPEFAEYARSAAMKMVTGVFTDVGKTWRQAARNSMRGRKIYEALLAESKGPMGLVLQEQIGRNAGLIKTLPANLANSITEYIAAESMKGRRAEDIAREIQQRFPKNSKARAELIARTESGKTSTAITRARSELMGLDWYVWRTSKDERVRWSHDYLEGVLVKWTDPPSPERLIGERDAGHYHAGEIYNCRCYPQPLVSLDEITWPRKVYAGGHIRRVTRAQFAKIAA